MVGEYMIGLVAQNWLIWIRYASARPADTWSLGHDYFGLIAFQAVGRRRRRPGLKLSLQRWCYERGRVSQSLGADGADPLGIQLPFSPANLTSSAFPIQPDQVPIEPP